MAIKRLLGDLHIIPGLVNIYVIETDDGLVVLDTGFPGSLKKIAHGIAGLGKRRSDVRHILLTHAHPDHIGSAAALKRLTGATVWSHRVDAPIIRSGKGFRPMSASPGLRNRIVAGLLLGRVKAVEPTEVDRFLEDGEALPFLPDMVAMHVPGHCAGQIAFHWRRSGGVLFTADTCIYRGGFKLTMANEDIAIARDSLSRLAKLDFEMACVMHGRPVTTGADALFRATSF